MEHGLALNTSMNKIRISGMKTPFQGLRSPRETMAGWVHLPRLIDKIRLHASGRLPVDYQPNFGKGFDGRFLEATGITLEQLSSVVLDAKDDASVEVWIKEHIKKSTQEMEAFNQFVLHRGKNDSGSEKLEQIKKENGLENRVDIQTFVQLIDFDEGRLT